MNILVSLYKGYGLGDAVMMSAVLRHLRKHRPDWILDFQAEEGRHQVGRGIAHHTFAYGQPYPVPEYTGEVQILLYDNFANWSDRPNTRVSSCLRDRFGMDWDADCGRYQINVSDEAYEAALEVVPRHAVTIHYRGDSAKRNKDLDEGDAADICGTIARMRYRPLLLDWRDNSLLGRSGDYESLGADPKLRGWGGNAEMNAAVISQCAAFIGIDSGPAKCASATETPSLVVWTGHHPAAHHDPAPNTTHLVPDNYQGLHPIVEGPALEFFLKNYKIRHYDRRSGPVQQVREWLEEVLGR